MKTYRAEYRLCYAHRVWDPNYSYDDQCRMIHGHTADISIVVNYHSDANLHRHVESAIDETLDFMTDKFFNRFFIDKSDPMFYTLVTSLYEGIAEEFKVDVTSVKHITPIVLSGTGKAVANEVNLQPFSRAKNSPVYDILRSYLVTDFCPSSDNLARWFADIVTTKIVPVGATLEQVEWSSVPNRKIIFRNT